MPPKNPRAVEIKTSPIAPLSSAGSPAPSAIVFAVSAEKAFIMPSTVPMMPTTGRSCSQAPTLASLVALGRSVAAPSREDSGVVYGFASGMTWISIAPGLQFHRESQRFQNGSAEVVSRPTASKSRNWSAHSASVKGRWLSRYSATRWRSAARLSSMLASWDGMFGGYRFRSDPATVRSLCRRRRMRRQKLLRGHHGDGAGFEVLGVAGDEHVRAASFRSDELEGVFEVTHAVSDGPVRVGLRCFGDFGPVQQADDGAMA